MSNINISRIIKNIRIHHTTIYSPVIEIIVNAIQAIEENNLTDSEGKIEIRLLRSNQLEIENNLPNINGFEIKDNGIGFNDKHREAFDTLFTDIKIKQGGKGFGRFICLKYFKELHVESLFRDDKSYKKRCFSMGKEQEIIVNEVNEKVKVSNEIQSGTTVTLSSLISENINVYEKKLTTIARNLVESLLPYFISPDFKCPKILLVEHDNSSKICLNDFVNNKKLSAKIQEVSLETNKFTLKGDEQWEDFHVRVFKCYAPGSKKSRVSLVANQREVTCTSLHNYIPEFKEEFYEKGSNREEGTHSNYIIKAYVFGEYLDKHVSLERGEFDFPKDQTNSLIRKISQSDIEKKTAEFAKNTVGNEITLRQKKKYDQVQSYVDKEAPWHKTNLINLDLSELPYKPTKENIELHLHRERFLQETIIKEDVSRILSETSMDRHNEDVSKIVEKISNVSKNELIHYIALRKKILEIFGKSLELDDSGKYPSEGMVHDIIFPRKGDSEITSFDEHNLWILDERLNFANYVSSDLSLKGKNGKRPDLLVFDKRVMFRGDNEPSNPITIFEFKRPQRGDFANQSFKDDPVKQIISYVKLIKDGKFHTPKGRNIKVDKNTPFYGFLVCDISPKVQNWLEIDKDFKPMPDNLGWFHRMSNINLHIEVLSWDKVLKDATMRNKVFFKKLGI